MMESRGRNNGVNTTITGTPMPLPVRRQERQEGKTRRPSTVTPNYIIALVLVVLSFILFSGLIALNTSSSPPHGNEETHGPSHRDNRNPHLDDDTTNEFLINTATALVPQDTREACLRAPWVPTKVYIDGRTDTALTNNDNNDVHDIRDTLQSTAGGSLPGDVESHQVYCKEDERSAGFVLESPTTTRKQQQQQQQQQQEQQQLHLVHVDATHRQSRKFLNRLVKAGIFIRNSGSMWWTVEPCCKDSGWPVNPTATEAEEPNCITFSLHVCDRSVGQVHADMYAFYLNDTQSFVGATESDGDRAGDDDDDDEYDESSKTNDLLDPRDINNKNGDRNNSNDNNLPSASRLRYRVSISLTGPVTPPCVPDNLFWCLPVPYIGNAGLKRRVLRANSLDIDDDAALQLIIDGHGPSDDQDVGGGYGEKTEIDLDLASDATTNEREQVRRERAEDRRAETRQQRHLLKIPAIVALADRHQSRTPAAPQNARFNDDFMHPEHVCGGDGDCVTDRCGNQCVNWRRSGNSGNCPGYVMLEEAYCGCVEGQCSWFKYI